MKKRLSARIKFQPGLKRAWRDSIPITHEKELIGFLDPVMETSFVFVTHWHQKFDDLVPLHGNPSWRSAVPHRPPESVGVYSRWGHRFVARLSYLASNHHVASIGEPPKTRSPFIAN
ncbi:MAG TPA: hypothetical protein VMB22_07470 [Verrucomicrobiae bacterium]|nr:hypothetical protein [Verrucomicrobiae bacterium]